MSNDSKCDDVELSRLYQVDKNLKHLPRAIKHKTMHIAQKANRSSKSNLDWINWARGAAATAATLLLIGFVTLHSLYMTPDVTSHYVSIEYHDLDSSSAKHVHTPLITYETFREHLDKHQYTRSELTTTLAEVVSDDQGLALRTCANRQLNLSHRLIDRMRQQKRLEADLAKGRRVNIQFNKQGHIIWIESANNACLNV